MLAHRLKRRARPAGEIPLQFARDTLPEMLRQQDDVLRAYAQRGKRDDVEGEAIQQVGAETAICGAGGQVDIGGGDDAHVRGDRVFAAQPLELAVFDHAQEFLLHLKRGRRDLVEEKRAAIGLFEAALTALGGAGERARLVAEQFGIQKVFGQRPAVHFDEGLFPPRGQVVQALGDQFLAGAAFANDHDRALDQRRQRHPFKAFQPHRGLTD